MNENVLWTEKSKVLLDIFDGFYLNVQMHAFRKTKNQAVVHAVQASVKSGFKITAAHFVLQGRWVIAAEADGLERQGMCYSQQGEAAFDVAHFVTVKIEYF